MVFRYRRGKEYCASLSGLHPEQVGMGTGVDEVQYLEVLLNTVDEQPVGQYMTLAAALVLSRQCMVAVFGSQLAAFGQRKHRTIQFVHRQTAFLRPFV